MLKLKPQAIAVALAFLFALSQAAQAFPVAARLDFRLKTTDGGEISSEMLRGDVVVLAFGASWLPLSKAQVQGVQELADEFGEQNGGLRVRRIPNRRSRELRALRAAPRLRPQTVEGRRAARPERRGLQVRRRQLPNRHLTARAKSPARPRGLDPRRKLVDVLGPRLRTLLAEK